MKIHRFQTQRLDVLDWSDAVLHSESRAELFRELDAVLTHTVLEHLPPSLQRGQGPNAVSDWVTARSEESDVALVRERKSGTLLGVLILADVGVEPSARTLHIGYLLCESAWGKGYASEVLQGLVSSLQGEGPLQILGGVDAANPASARVLEKAGFSSDPTLSAEDTVMFRLDIP